MMREISWPVIDIIISDGTLSLRSETRLGCLLSLLLFNILCEVFAVDRKRNRNCKHQERRSKVIFIYNGMILYTENSKESTLHILLNLRSIFSKVQRYKLIMENLYVYTLSTNNQKRKLKVNTIYNRINIIKYLQIIFKRCTRPLHLKI